MEHVLVVSTDPDLISQVRASLDGQAYEVERVQTGLEALQRMYITRPDLIILDGRSLDFGIRNSEFGILRRVREVTDLPILMFVSEGQVAEGLNQGADDGLPVYDTQGGLSFPAEELAARVGALLRRSRLPSTREWKTRYVDDHLSINLTQKRVMVQGERVHLTPLEFGVLACLVGEAGEVVPHDELMRRVWGPEHVGKHNLLTPCISNLRRKIEPDPTEHEYILTDRGFGYRFKAR